MKLDSIEDLVKKIKQDENKLDKSIKNIEKQELEILGKLESYEGQVEKSLLNLKQN